MFKTRHIIAVSTAALIAVATASYAVSSSLSDNADDHQAAAWGAKAVAYQKTMLDGAQDIDAFAAQNTNMSISRDYAQIEDLIPVTYVHRQAAEFIRAEQNCLAKAVYYEARSESRSGQMAVAEVVLNRVKSKHYPNSVCGVVYQGSGRTTGCQFSFMCDGSMNKMPNGKLWKKSLDIAAFMYTYDGKPFTHGATHYHTTAINPKWSANLRFDRQIGTHKFYRFNFTERSVVNAPPIAIAPPI